MKRISFILILLITFFNIDIVMADGCDDVTLTSKGNPGGSGLYFGGYQVYNYEVYVNGSSKTAICHDPGVHAWDRSGETLKCLRVVGDPTSTDTVQNIFDAGINSIMSDSTNHNKWLTINFYQLLFPTKVDVRFANGDLHSRQVFYFEYQVSRYLNESNKDANAVSLREKIKTLKRYAGTTVGTPYNVSNSYSNYNNEASSISGVISKVLNAFDAAIDYAKNGGTAVTINKNPKRTKSSTETEEINKFTYNLDVNNFSENGEIYLDYSCTSGCSYVTSTKFYLNGNEIQAGNLSSTNIRTLLTEEIGSSGEKNYSGKVEFVIEFTGPKVEECSDTTYNLSLRYKDSRLEKYSYEVSTGERVGENQRLYVLGNTNSNVFRTTTLNNSFKMCTNKLEADSCKTYISDVSCEVCKEDNNKIEIKEGYDEEDVCVNPTEDKLDIKKCVANDNAKDTAGNTHKKADLTTEAGSDNFVNNSDGRGIYCKEDFMIEFPGSKKVDSGRYFTLRAKIDGTESCYSTRIKDNDSTNAQVKANAKSTVDGYKLYSNAKALLECLNGPESDTCIKISYYVFGGECDSEIRYNTYTTSPDKDGKCPDGYSKSGDTCSQTTSWTKHYYYWIPGIGVTWYYDYYDSASCSKITTSSHVNYEDESLKRCKYDDKPFDFDSDAEAENLKPLVAGALGRASTVSCSVGSADTSKGLSGSVRCTGSGATGFTATLGTGGMYSILENYNKVIGFYTGGASMGGEITDGASGYTGSGEGSYGVMINPHPFGGWQMNYNFNPELHYWYPEPYMNDIKNDAFEKTKESMTREPTEYCVGDVSKDYKECSTGWTTTLTEGNGGVETDKACACTTDGCQMYSYVLNNAKYIKQSEKGSAEFITPTQFYSIFPTPNIGMARPGTEIPNGEELTNGLPVSLNAQNGLNNYLLWFENLGEYFDGDKLGRIWGDYNSVIATTLLAQTSEACGNDNPALKYDYTYNGEYKDEGLYVCRYDVNVCNDDQNDSGCSPTPDGVCTSGCPDDPDCFCPSCPPDVKNRCSILKDEGGGDHYIGKNGTEVSKQLYESQCCPSGHCGVYCPTCLYNGQDLQVIYRQITNEDVNPTERELGKNWAFDEIIDSAIELKAKVTTEEIQNNNNDIFDIDFSDENSSSDAFAMQVKMDMQTMSWIRSYNNNHNGYIDGKLNCYDLEANGKTYKNIYCYSDFIDQILVSEVKDNVKILGPERPAEGLRKTNSDTYFTSWVKAGTNIDPKWSQWNISDTVALEYTKHFGIEYDEATGKETDYHVGPSWK